jgi:galactokinase
MTGRELAAALVARGLDTAAGAAKAALFDVVLGAFRGHTGELPRHAWWVPGRLEVFGKHTDYAGGRTLVCAVPNGLAVAASPRADGSIHVVDARRGDRLVLRRLEHGGFTGWRHYVEVAARRLAANFPGAALGADIVFSSDLPRASGMSSSSALVIAMSSALVRVAGIDERSEWRTNIHDTRDVAGYFACIENGMSFGTLTGDAGVGTHGGSEDHAAILAGTPGQLSAFAFVPMRPAGRVVMPEDWRFVLAPSVIRSAKTGNANAAYNHLARGAEVLLELWNHSHPPAPSLGAVVELEGVGALRDLVDRSSLADWPAHVLRKRLEHFVREDARVPDALDAFRAADVPRLEALAESSQADAEHLLGNQVPETIALARLARERGALAACSFGAGFGGSVWALVDRDAEGFARGWQSGAFVARPSPPVTLLS